MKIIHYHSLLFICVLNHLRRDVLQRSAEGVRGAQRRPAALREAEVREPDVPVLVEQGVLELHVPVNDVLRVQIPMYILTCIRTLLNFYLIFGKI